MFDKNSPDRKWLLDDEPDTLREAALIQEIKKLELELTYFRLLQTTATYNYTEATPVKIPAYDKYLRLAAFGGHDKSVTEPGVKIFAKAPGYDYSLGIYVDDIELANKWKVADVLKILLENATKKLVQDIARGNFRYRG